MAFANKQPWDGVLVLPLSKLLCGPEAARLTSLGFISLL